MLISIDNLGRIVVPKSVREKYNIKKGSKIYLTCEEDKIIIRNKRSIPFLSEILNLSKDSQNYELIKDLIAKYLD